jgi:hypothetical protein
MKHIGRFYPMVRFFLILLAVSSARNSSFAQIDFNSGGDGVQLAGQSFNETRGAKIIPNQSIRVLSASVSHLNLLQTNTVGLRVYKESDQSLLYTQTSTQPAGNDAEVRFNTDFVLEQGIAYRFSFYVNPANGAPPFSSGTLYKPTFPYVESENMLKIESGHAVGADAFPANPNLGIPFIKLKYSLVEDKADIDCCKELIEIKTLLQRIFWVLIVLTIVVLFSSILRLRRNRP